MKAVRFILKTLCSGLVFLGICMNFSACNGGSSHAIDEGVIEYDTRAVDPSHPLAGFAPSSAILKFKKDKFLMEMCVMGMFNTNFVCDLKAKTLTQMVKFMNIKQACIETEKDIHSETAEYQLNVEELPGTKEIAGYKCKKLKVSLVQDPSIVFEAYYTQDMGVENVNSLSPYLGVKGMLMQYRLKKMGLELEFTARSVKKEEVPDNTFEVPGYFKIVSREEMQKLFNELQ